MAAASSRSSPAARPEDHQSPPSIAEDCTPRMDMEFETELQGYDLYRLYASKLGLPRAAVPAPDGRTGCNAHLTLRRSKPGGSFQVSGFQPRHNHPLFAAHRSPHSPFHSPSNAAAVPIPDFVDGDATAGRHGPREGPCAPGGSGDQVREAAALLNHLQQQSLADPAFHHAVQLDVEDKKVIGDRRHRELEMEYGSRQMMPYLKIRAPVLTQASEVYTSVIFQLFQEEYEEFQSAYIASRDESGLS
ncbi:hypothetical protein ZWY2020_007009 [Hordeum vulgare]|nr:hypothetical protein ZWY2020_007009 [Hordeum vulgare]